MFTRGLPEHGRVSRTSSRSASVQHELAAARRQIAALARQLVDLRQRSAYQHAGPSLPALPAPADDRYPRHTGKVLDSIGEAFWEADHEGRLRHANRTLLSMGGWSIDEVRGRSLDELFAPQGGGSLLDKLAEEGRLTDVHVEVMDPGGSRSRMWLSARFAETERDRRRVIRGLLRQVRAAGLDPPPADKGELQASLADVGQLQASPTDQGQPQVSAADLEHDTAHHRVQDARSLEKMEQLAAGIAHEFNNLLSVILGSAELALLETEPDHASWTELQRVCSTAQRAADRCAQLLAYSGKSALTPESLDLSRLVEGQWESLCRSVGPEVTLTRALDPEPPAIDADPRQLEEVVAHLVTNAWEAMNGRRGTISIATRRQSFSEEQLRDVIGDLDLREQDCVVLEVEDDGCGMDQTVRDCLFDPFFSTKLLGRGLGLSTTFGIVRAHRGALQVVSQPGQGTTIRVLLPVAQGRAKERPKAPPSSRPWTLSGNLLFIDDEGSVREMARRMLVNLGFDVVLAEDGRVGVQLFRMLQAKLDAVVVDMSMPELSGEETLRQIRALDPEVPVIVTSGHDVRQVADRLRSLNISGTLQKPFRLAMLKDALGQALASEASRSIS